MKRTVAVICLALLLFLPAGCWNRVELDQRAIVAGLGVDPAGEAGKLKITVQVVNIGEIKAVPQLKGVSQKAVTVYTGTGYTIFDAFRDLSITVGKKLFLSEVGVLVIGEALAREGIDRVLDFYERDHEPDTRDYLLVARGEAKDILETELRTDKIWAYGLSRMVEASTAHSKAPVIEIRDFLKAVEHRTSAPVATVVQVVEPEKKAGEAANGAMGATLPKNLAVAGTAVFRNYQLAGWLDEKETRGMLWVNGQVQSGIIVIPSPETGDKLVTNEIIRARSEIQPEITDGKLTVNVFVQEHGRLGEIQPGALDITQPGAVKELEKSITSVIEDEISAAVKKTRSLNADIFGFGEVVRRKYPEEWRQLKDRWDIIFPTLEVSVAVDAKIHRTGKIAGPTEPK